MHTELNRRDVLKTIGGAGLAAVFGARALDFLGDDAQAATTCLLTPEVTEGPYWVDTSLTRRDVRSGKAGPPARSALHDPEREDVQRDQERRRRDLALRRPRQLLGRERGLDPLPPRPPEVEREREGGVPDDLPRVVPRPHAAHPHEGLRRRQGGPHRTDLLQREDHGSRLQAGSLRRAAGRTTRRTRATTSTSRRAARTRR